VELVSKEVFMYVHRSWILCVLVVLSLWQPLPAQAQSHCFAETSFCIEGRIREFWEQQGGLTVFGYPISEQREEWIEGKAVQVQWFERNRLELHPENARPYDVLLGRLGADRLEQLNRNWYEFEQGSAGAGCRFFAETGHSICGDILRMWNSYGLEFDGRAGKSEAENLALFGLPLSEPQLEQTPNGEFMVQWFERARFELHPELAPPYNVQLGLLGNELASNAAAPSEPDPTVIDVPRVPDTSIEWGRAYTATSRRIRSFYPQVVVDSNNNSHVIYANGEGQLMYTNTIGGGSFGTHLPIDTGLGANNDPYFGLALGPNNTLHAAYIKLGGDRQVYYRVATIDGDKVNWAPAQRISEAQRPFAAQIAVDAQGNAHIAWIDRHCNTYNVFYRQRRVDTSLSDIEHPVPTCSYQNRPQLTTTLNGAVHLVFQHDRDIEYARRDAVGWHHENIANSRRTSSYNPSITSDGSALYVAWEEADNNHDILFRRSNDGGQSWQTIRDLSGSESYASYPNLFYNPASQRVYAVWSDVKNFNHNDPYVVFASYNVNDDTYTPAQRLAQQDGRAMHPSVAAGPNIVSVVWQFLGNSNWQLYHITGTITQ
jgi:hypothetical protein